MGNYYLAIETATKMCSVALFQDEQLLENYDEGGAYSHAEKLAPLTQKILAENNLTVGSLSAVAISSGPGSYTGLRIGLSLAKGLCVAADLPLISISTLQGMTAGAVEQYADTNALFCPMVDARRLEVYTALFEEDLRELSPTEAKIIDSESFKEILRDKKVYFFGDGASKCKEFIVSSNAIFLENEFISASNWGKLIDVKYKSESFENLAYYEPFYYKDFRAGKPKPLL